MSVQTHGSVRHIDEAPCGDGAPKPPATDFFDSHDGALSRCGIVLSRRRAGGDDDGWRLHVLEDEGAWEVMVPLLRTAPERMPAVLRKLMEGVTGGAELELAQAPDEPSEGTGHVPETGDDLLRHMISQLTRDLVRWDLKVRLDVPDAVHQMRVTARSLRSVLKAGERFLEGDLVSVVESWLRELGRELSAARDAEVVLEMLPERAEARGDVIEPGFMERELSTARRRLRDTSAGVRRHLGRPAHAGGLARLRDFAADPPITAGARDLAPRKMANKMLRRALKKTRKAAARSERFRQSGESTGMAGRLTHLHSVRKAAKRVRYVAAAVDRAGVVPGPRVRHAGEDAKRVQKSLGETMDAMVLETWLRHRAETMRGSRADHYALGVLHGAELERVRAGVEQGPAVIRELLPDS